MRGAGSRVGVGTRFRYDGESVEVTELTATTSGNEVILKDSRGRVRRLTLRELLFTDRAEVIPEEGGPSADNVEEVASVVLGQLHDNERQALLERAEHVREVLSGYLLRWHRQSPADPSLTPVRLGRCRAAPVGGSGLTLLMPRTIPR
ncbi:hypothetical protein ACIRD9_41940 [Streptomyces violaceus]|uniref:hypothetical protein n=1 Tax=Streptomyces violaceus TaxID=1936 RepID=UPI003818205C